MRRNFSLSAIFFLSLTAVAAPKYPAICTEMSKLAREIAQMNDAMVEQMRNLEDLEKKQQQEWGKANDQERRQMEKFCVDSKNKLLNIRKTINVILQQNKS